MSLWQFQAAVNGYLEAHVPETGPKQLSEQERREIEEIISGH